MLREVVLDIEATGFFTSEGHRILEVTAVEMKGRKLTGKEIHILVNPDRDIPADSTKVHGITDKMVADKPFFATVAKQLKDFIGDSPIVITCRTYKDGYTLDVEFLNMEMKQAGFPPFKDAQWVNVRRWSEAMFGDENATLNKVLDHYKVDRSERDREGHTATLDAHLLAAVYPKLLADYTKFTAAQKKSKATPKISPPSI